MPSLKQDQKLIHTWEYYSCTFLKWKPTNGNFYYRFDFNPLKAKTC